MKVSTTTFLLSSSAAAAVSETTVSDKHYGMVKKQKLSEPTAAEAPLTVSSSDDDEEDAFLNSSSFTTSYTSSSSSSSSSDSNNDNIHPTLSNWRESSTSLSIHDTMTGYAPQRRKLQSRSAAGQEDRRSRHLLVNTDGRCGSAQVADVGILTCEEGYKCLEDSVCIQDDLNGCTVETKYGNDVVTCEVEQFCNANTGVCGSVRAYQTLFEDQVLEEDVCYTFFTGDEVTECQDCEAKYPDDPTKCSGINVEVPAYSEICVHQQLCFQIEIPEDDPATCTVELGGPIGRSGDCTSCEIDENGCLQFDCTNLNARTGRGLTGDTCKEDPALEVLDGLLAFKPKIQLDEELRDVGTDDDNDGKMLGENDDDDGATPFALAKSFTLALIGATTLMATMTASTLL